jgi:hypothetical protein
MRFIVAVVLFALVVSALLRAALNAIYGPEQ